MLFEYRYFGNTAVDAGVSSTGLSFAPDTSREPTYFQGRVRQKLAFRECISALHHVVVSDLRFKPRDRTEYFAWLAQQELVDAAQVAADQQRAGQQLVEAKKELDELMARHRTRRAGYYAAQERYFSWLYKKNLDYWFVLDPVITVHPDEVFFECFSQDESSYGRVGCRHEVFESVGEFACGTTNVDYSSTLYDEFQKIRDYRDTNLTVDPQGFEVQTSTSEAYREVKIDLPESWVRGFLQVSSAMTLPGFQFDLHPMEVHNLLFWLRRNKERKSPRSLRFHLDPGQPIRVTVEPWNKVITCTRSPYPGSSAQEIRVWGRRRLFLLERLIPMARAFRVVLLGTGMPSFWIADCGDISFTLGLSGWTANDWAAAANFDLLAPRADVDTDTAAQVFAALKEDWRATPEALSARLQLDRGLVRSALQQYTQAGRVMYDLNGGVFRVRELSRDPFDMDTLRWSNEREEQAATLVARNQVTHRHARVDASGHTVLQGQVAGHRPTVILNPDQRIVRAECSCSFYFRNKLRQGPCEHMLALRLAHDRGVGEVEEVEEAYPEPPHGGTHVLDGALYPTPAVVPSGAPAGQVIRLPPRGGSKRREERENNAERFLAWLVERGLLELGPDYEELLGPVGAILAERDIPSRVVPFLRLLNSRDEVEEHYLELNDLESLFEEWG